MFALTVAASAGARVAPTAAPRAPAARKPTAVSIAVPTKTAVRGASLVRRAGDNIIGSNVSGRDESVAGLGGDIGARDATPGEIESGFNAKSIGEADTEHMLKVPEGIREVTELVNRSCVALDGSEGTLDDEAQKLVYQKQVADWKIRMVDGHEVLRREYRTANADDAKEVINRLNTVAECESKTVDSFVEGPGVRIEIWSKAVNGLHINDFILAAKIDQLDLSDKVTKKPPNVFLI